MSHIFGMSEPHKDTHLLDDLNIDYPAYLLFITFDCEWLELFTNFHSILKAERHDLWLGLFERIQLYKKDFRMLEVIVAYLKYIYLIYIYKVYIYQICTYYLTMTNWKRATIIYIFVHLFNGHVGKWRRRCISQQNSTVTWLDKWSVMSSWRNLLDATVICGTPLTPT